MSSNPTNDLEFLQVRAVSIAVSDAERAKRFYGETLGLPLESERHMEMAYEIGEVILLLKSEKEWYGKPSQELNARVTLRVKDAYATEKALIERGVTISDPVTIYDKNPVGGFLDSEGNKLWFCSDAGESGGS